METLGSQRTSTNSLKLLGAPDDNIGNPSKEQHISRSLQLRLPQQIVEDIVKCSDAGKPVHFSFGPSPLLRFGNASRAIRVSPSAFRVELYGKGAADQSELHFDSLISHQAILAQAREATKPAEDALATLQASFAQYDKDKQDNSATFIRDEQHGSKSELGNYGIGLGITSKSKASRGLKTKALLRNAGRQISTSPSVTPNSKFSSYSSHPSSSQPSTLHPPVTSHNQAKTQAQRFALFHFLAMGPASEETIHKKTVIPKEDLTNLLDKFAQLSTSENPQWELRERWYKDLQVWTFKYSSDEDRQKAVDNCIRAFDRQRIPREDKLWQKLLPKDKRGKGICLSKLNLGATDHSNSKSLGSRDDQTSADQKPSLSAAGAETAAAKKSADKQPPKPAPKASAESPDHTKSASQPALYSPPRHKRKSSFGNERPKEIAEDEEGGADLDKLLDSVNASDNESKSKIKPARESKQVNTGSKSKSGGKFKSAEYINDSDELLEDAALEAGDQKRLKTNEGVSKPARPISNLNSSATTKKSETTPKVGPPRVMDKISTKTITKSAQKSGKADQQLVGKSGQSKANTSSQDAGNKPAATQANAPPKGGVNSVGGASLSQQVKNDSVKTHRHSRSLPTNSTITPSVKPTNGVKRPGDGVKEPETPSKKSRPNTQTTGAGRHGSSSSPATNNSDPHNISPPLVSIKSSNETAKKSLKTSGTSGAGSEEIHGAKKGSSGSSQSSAGPSHGARNALPAESSQDSTILKALRKEYNQRFQDHIAMHFAFDKLPVGAVRDDSKYIASHDKMRALAETIKIYMEKAGHDSSLFTYIPRNFSTASVPGLMDWLQQKLVSLNRSLRAERELAADEDESSPAQKRRIADIQDEINDLKTLRDH